jgi:hypothetical protein
MFSLPLVLGPFLFISSVQVLKSELECLKTDQPTLTGLQEIERCADNSESEFVKTDEDDDVEHFCFGVWEDKALTSNGRDITVKGAGCIASSWKAKTHSSCTQKECVADIRSVKMYDQDQEIIYCCCNTSRCNEQYILDPRQVWTTTTDQPYNKQIPSEENPVIYLLGCVGLVSIICVLLLVWCLVVQNTEEGESKNRPIGQPFSENQHIILCPKETNSSNKSLI